MHLLPAQPRSGLAIYINIQTNMELVHENPTPQQTPAEEKRYLYTPIEGPGIIRILILHSGFRDDPLSGELHHVSLSNLEHSNDSSDDRGYEAVSYVWGKPIFNRNITCSGRAISITPNLEKVLLRVRLRDRSRRLWIDGVCINQQDFTERGHQVKVMDRIYSAASRVLIWLSSARMAARKLRELQVHSIKDRAGKTSIKKTNYHCRTFVEQMIQCRWFTRLWVVLECLQSRSTFFKYGDGEVDVQIVLAAIRYLQEGNYPISTRNWSWLNLLDARIPTFLDALQATWTTLLRSKGSHLRNLRYFICPEYKRSKIRSIH